MRKPDTAELRKRAAVYARASETVIFKISAMGKVDGLPQIERDEAAIIAKHKAEAEARGLDFQAYRDHGDTGHCWKNKAEEVSVRALIGQLEERGMNFVGGHCHIKPGGGPVTTLTFSSVGKPQKLPAEVRRMLQEMVWNHCTVWCNLKYRDPADPSIGQFRLDTINLAKGKFGKDLYQRLKIKGNTYELV